MITIIYIALALMALVATAGYGAVSMIQTVDHTFTQQENRQDARRLARDVGERSFASELGRIHAPAWTEGSLLPAGVRAGDGSPVWCPAFGSALGSETRYVTTTDGGNGLTAARPPFARTVPAELGDESLYRTLEVADFAAAGSIGFVLLPFDPDRTTSIDALCGDVFVHSATAGFVSTSGTVHLVYPRHIARSAVIPVAVGGMDLSQALAEASARSPGHAEIVFQNGGLHTLSNADATVLSDLASRMNVTIASFGTNAENAPVVDGPGIARISGRFVVDGVDFRPDVVVGPAGSLLGRGEARLASVRAEGGSVALENARIGSLRLDYARAAFAGEVQLTGGIFADGSDIAVPGVLEVPTLESIVLREGSTLRHGPGAVIEIGAGPDAE